MRWIAGGGRKLYEHNLLLRQLATEQDEYMEKELEKVASSIRRQKKQLHSLLAETEAIEAQIEDGSLHRLGDQSDDRMSLPHQHSQGSGFFEILELAKMPPTLPTSSTLSLIFSLLVANPAYFIRMHACFVKAQMLGGPEAKDEYLILGRLVDLIFDVYGDLSLPYNEHPALWRAKWSRLPSLQQ